MKQPETVADEAEGQWHKILAAVMAKLGTEDVTVSMPELEAITGKAVVLSHQDEGRVLRVRLLPEAEALRFMELYRAGKMRDGEVIG